MKVDIYNNNLIIVFLMNEKDRITGTNKKSIGNTLKILFSKLKIMHGINLNGYYNIEIYADKHYGIVIEIINQNEFFPIYNGEIEMQVNINHNDFFYEIEDILLLPKNLLEKVILYKVDNKNYLKIKKGLTNLELGYLLEISKLVYNPLILKANPRRSKKPPVKLLNNVIFK